ncbi:MAG: hypothetical protein MR922_00950 [Lachnospiraceae bacterium]|nr:hypothetical protein [Lachnospiraceae bacterium]
MGKMENYPKFMSDPATKISIVESSGTGKEAELLVEFLSPESRSTPIYAWHGQ